MPYEVASKLDSCGDNTETFEGMNTVKMTQEMVREASHILQMASLEYDSHHSRDATHPRTDDLPE